MTNLQELHTTVRHCAIAEAEAAHAAGKTVDDAPPFWAASEGVCAALYELGFDSMPASASDTFRRNYEDTMLRLCRPEEHAAEEALPF